MENIRAAMDDAAIQETAITPIGGVASPSDWNTELGRWPFAACEICGAAVFKANVDPHRRWHERLRG